MRSRGVVADNAQGEEYLTDVIGLLEADDKVVSACVTPDPNEVLGVNDRVQLAAAGGVLRDRAVVWWQRAGVTIVDPATTWIGPDVQLEPDVTLHPGVQLHGKTTVRAGATIGPDTTLFDTVVGEDALVVRAQCHSSEIGPRANVGPFTYLRPGTKLEADSKAGAYVELKNSVVGEGSKVPHLSYVGDAIIGEGSNIGAATVFVNYDGQHKHATIVGDHVRIGSDTMLIAPVTIGDGAYTAAGSVIDKDVPAWGHGRGSRQAAQRRGVGRQAPSRQRCRRRRPRGARTGPSRAVSRTLQTRQNQSKASRPPSTKGRVRDRHQEPDGEDAQAFQRPGASGAGLRGRREPRRRPGARQRRTTSPMARSSSGSRSPYAVATPSSSRPTHRTSTSGSWST